MGAGIRNFVSFFLSSPLPCLLFSSFVVYDLMFLFVHFSLVYIEKLQVEIALASRVFASPGRRESQGGSGPGLHEHHCLLQRWYRGRGLGVASIFYSKLHCRSDASTKGKKFVTTVDNGFGESLVL